MANVSKYKIITCQPGDIITWISEEDFSWRSKVEGDTYQDRLRQCIPCRDCRVDLTDRYMTDY